MDLCVVTANLHGLRSGVAGVADLLGPENIDVAMLQETGPRDAFRRLAERLGMERVADPPAVLRRRVQNGLLLRRPWRVAGVEHHRFSGSASWHPRGAVIALVVRGGSRFWSVSTHLGLEGGERRRHADELQAIMRDRRPIVLGGDLNADDESRVVAILGEGAIDVGLAAGPTFPSSGPTARIDYLFVSPEVLIRGVRVMGDEGASDHRAVIADITIPPG